MTRGRIVIILNNEVMLVSWGFNGDMYYSGYGKKVIKALKNIENEKQYREFIDRFNAENFQYDDELVYVVNGDKYYEKLNMSNDYFRKWFVDYIYIKNLSDEDVTFTDEYGYKYMLKPNAIGVFYFGSCDDDIEENQLELNMTDKEKYLQSLINDDNVDINDMYNKCLDLEDVYTDSIYSKETLIDIMYEHAKNGYTFYAMAKDIDDNSGCDLFLFDYSCWGQGCTPIETKEELAEVLLTGSL